MQPPADQFHRVAGWRRFEVGVGGFVRETKWTWALMAPPIANGSPESARKDPSDCKRSSQERWEDPSTGDDGDAASFGVSVARLGVSRRPFGSADALGITGFRISAANS